ncbi:cysteine dioxygenase family protein [Amycolatopsis endophytica]|uniref:Putative metal-dependent enzyme (Double-stranded beta helix superfamily) n=1 Tax=Amycolatopsis endophytica TaxID=860233 RepID=A0A853B460_9PSEU|nr:cysteine dioxygenase family protein [Amycolatopsis endophytica]NYI89928.1 putative metal-dependent enzyme (double-stranded beta helix superfamily) [Amycolatopsis endophytica]
MTSVLPSSEIHPRLAESALGELLHPERLLWTPTQLAGLTRTVALEFGDSIGEFLHFDTDQRWWARLALTDGIELWVLTWLDGQHTAPHDHGGAAGSFTVLRGELDEEYRYPGGPVRQRRHATGDGIGFGAGRAHQVTGAAAGGSASIHAYSPPLVPTREYSSLADVPAEIPPLPGILR